MERDDRLPSWRPGSTRDALEAFLSAAEEVPVVDRVAYFDNDGTLWCERPSYVQLDFFLDALRKHVTEDPSIGERAEFAALLSGDQAAVGGIGLERIALALAGLFEGMTPQEFTSAAREFMGRAAHPTLDRPTRSVTYQPMSELIAELRRRDFTVGIVTGGGTEFVRAISDDLYGVPAELVVGTLIGYDVRSSGAPAACSASRTRAAPRSPTSRPSWAAGRSWLPATPGVTGRCWNGRRPPALPALRC
jgi:hypothetical protein